MKYILSRITIKAIKVPDENLCESISLIERKNKRSFISHQLFSVKIKLILCNCFLNSILALHWSFEDKQQLHINGSGYRIWHTIVSHLIFYWTPWKKRKLLHNWTIHLSVTVYLDDFILGMVFLFLHRKKWHRNAFSLF